MPTYIRGRGALPGLGWLIFLGYLSVWCREPTSRRISSAWGGAHGLVGGLGVFFSGLVVIGRWFPECLTLVLQMHKLREVTT